MFQYSTQREMPVPLAAAIAYLADATKQTEWVHGVSECQWRDPQSSPSLGAVADQTMTFMGRTRVVPMDITAYEPGLRVAFHKDSPFTITFEFMVEPRGSSCLVHYNVEMEPRGLFRLVIPLNGRRTIEGDLDRIARHLSAEPSASPSASTQAS